MSNNREIDSVTGVETTGHQWDGIKELNKPLPRWWLMSFYVSIIWAIGYWIAYPAWPTVSSYTKGVLGYSQRSTLASEVQAAQQAQGGMRDLLAKTPLADIKKNPELLRFATAGGAASFQTNCGPCHGRAAQGAFGYPNLNDDDWLWGGKIEEIEETILRGVRSDNAKARSSQMPKFGIDKLLTDAQISDTTEFVLSISGAKADAAAAARGATVFKEQCATCHGDTGKGMIEQGAPNLTDAIWLYGSSRDAVATSIRTGRGGMMPAWEGRLDPVTIKSLAIYVHSLGGGK